jgi:hypothetical protein
MNQFPSTELEEIESECEWLLSSEMVTGKFPPSAYLEYLHIVTNLKQTIPNFCQCPIQTVHEDHFVMKARGKKR